MGAGSVPGDPVEGGLPSLVERLRRVHQLMVDAALTGDGFERVAELAAVEVGRPVAIVLPELDVSVVWPEASPARRAGLERFAHSRVDGDHAEIPDAVQLIVPVTYGSRLVGSVGMLAGEGEGGGDLPPEASEFLHLAATASATALALEQARERETVAPPGGLVEDVLGGRVAGADAAARADGRLGEGLVVCAVAVRSARPWEALALVSEVAPAAHAELVGERLYALVPARRGSEGEMLEAIAGRLSAHGPAVVSSFYADATDLPRALREADLMLDFDQQEAEGGRAASDVRSGAGAGVYRLLFRVLASHPTEVCSFYEDTIAPVARYDDQYRAELLPTLEAYLAHDCNMNATARAIYAHRHTVAYRLERVKELTGLDPGSSEDRERLGLGLKAQRIVAGLE